MSDHLAQRILELIYRDPEVRRMHKDALTDWILDTQSRTAPLDARSLLEYLADHQPDLLDRLKINVRIHDDLVHELGSVEGK